MESMIAYSFKDSEPIQTIQSIRNLFASLGLLTQESWKCVGSDVFSVHLAVLDSTLTSNGKGSTRELALASAYGELAERLSFLLPFRVSPFYRNFYDAIVQAAKTENSNLFIKMDFSEWLKTEDSTKYYTMLQNNAYRYSPDIDTTSYGDFDFRWIAREDACQNYHLVAQFNQLSVSSDGSLSLKDSILLPYALLDYYYGSNGMCAGNTDEEALVQGICEIIERYVQRRIILECHEGIYDITHSCIEKCPNIKRTYSILKNYGYDLRILECPVENVAPVVAVILVKSNGAYYVSMGCHPYTIIGAERALTELFQGYCMDDLNTAFVENFITHQSPERAQSNYINLLKYGVGIYPANFIMGKYLEKQIEVPADGDYLTNKQLLRLLIRGLEKENLKVHVCRGLPLGLCCFHVLVIGISEAESILPSTKIRDNNVDTLYSNLSALSRIEAEKLANRAVLLFESGSNTLEKILDIDKYSVYTNCTTSVKGISAALFISMLYIRAEKWNLAANYLKIYIDELSTARDVKREDMEYYCVLRTILEMKSYNWTTEQIKRSLNNVPNIEPLLSMIELQDELFAAMPQLSPNALLVESNSLMSAVKAEKTMLRKLLGGICNAKDIE